MRFADQEREDDRARVPRRFFFPHHHLKQARNQLEPVATAA